MTHSFIYDFEKWLQITHHDNRILKLNILNRSYEANIEFFVEIDCRNPYANRIQRTLQAKVNFILIQTEMGFWLNIIFGFVGITCLFIYLFTSYAKDSILNQGYLFHGGTYQLIEYVKRRIIV